MLKDLKGDERLLLLKFVCSFAWADLEVRDAERKLVHRMVKKLALSPDEAKQVESWLSIPPKPEEVDPNRIPREHRKLFLDAAREMIAADGEIDENERENLELFEMLLK
ncbi:MAG: TerB family tellurite resistance protein [Polyangiaceae bacterium]|nr:TerB family tellurite resistance protein [Polyangiaceae bacterium]